MFFSTKRAKKITCNYQHCIRTCLESQHFCLGLKLKNAFVIDFDCTQARVFLCLYQELVNEKQNRLKESMKMMGLANWIHWCAWFTKNLLFLLVTISIATILLKVTDTEISKNLLHPFNAFACT